uniref:Spc7 kinetochore protein domain-containing protein n=1 Tax=Alexandrium monilatum TaxID=311494 RepID=A0A7S4RHA6_9DINO
MEGRQSAVSAGDGSVSSVACAPGSGGGPDDSAGGGGSSRSLGADDLREGSTAGLDGGAGQQPSRGSFEKDGGGTRAAAYATPDRHRSTGSVAASDEGADSASPASGEVTAGVMSITKLIAQDELDAGEHDASGRWLGLPGTTPRPSRSPGAPSEASPLPESWDLFMQFKKTAPRPSTMSCAGIPERRADGEEAEAEAGAGSQSDREVCLPFSSAAVSMEDEPSPRSPVVPVPPIGREFSFSDTGATAAAVMAAANERCATPARAGGPGANVATPKASPRRHPGRVLEDTVDMAGFVGRIREGNAGHMAEEADESEVPEGRKSFAARHLARQAEAARPQAAPVGSRTGSPSTSRPSTGLPGSPEAAAGPGSARNSDQSQVFDFEKMNQEFDLRAGHVPSAADGGPGAGSVVDPNNRATGCSSGIHYPPGLGLLAGLGAQPHDRWGRGSLPRLPGQGRTSQGAASEVMDSSLHCSFVSTESAPLPGASSLHPISHALEESSNHSGFGTHMVWDDFLSNCRISFGPVAVPGMNTETALPQVPDGPHGNRLADLLGYKRILCMQQVHKDLDEKTRAVQQQLHGQVQRWNQASYVPPAALELMQARETERDLKHFLARAKSLHADCKVSAWTQWYAVKHDWLLKDLRAHRELTASLRQEEASLRECGRDLERHAKSIEAALRQQRARCEQLRSQRKVRSETKEDLRAAQQERQLHRRRAAEAKEALRTARTAVRNLEQSLEEARHAPPCDRVGDGYLQKRLRRVQLQQLRGMRTCLVSDRAGPSSTSYELSLRGGARARVARPVVSGAGSLARITLEQPPVEPPAESIAGLRPGAQALRKLARELFACTWRSLVKKLPHSAKVSVPTASALELTVPCCEVPRLVRRLDFAAVRVWEQIEALRHLRKGWPEVVQLDARLHDGGPGDEPMLVVAASLLLERCAVRVGSEAKVDASKCVVEFTADLSSFPEIISWSDISVRQVFGRGEASAVARALGCQGGLCRGGGGGLPDVLSAAVEAMRRAA